MERNVCMGWSLLMHAICIGENFTVSTQERLGWL